MKIAALPNEQLHFPDETPDEVMHAAVQNHVSQLQPEPQMPDVLSAAHMVGELITKLIPAAVSQVLDRQDQNSASQEDLKVEEIAEAKIAAEKIEEALNNLASVFETNSTATAAGHVVQILSGINQGIAELNHGLAFNAKNTAKLDDVVKAINSLATTLSDSTQAILHSLALRRDLIFDKDKMLKGIQQIRPKLSS